MRIMKPATAPPATDATSGTSTLYPDLPAASVQLQDNKNDTSHPYRLQEISQLKKRLEDERDKRAELYKKYRRGVNALDGVDTALLTVGMGMGVGGVGLLSTIIAAPVVLGLEIAALTCGVLGVSGKFVRRRLAVKAQKHGEVRVLAESKLNTIANHVSTALLDGQISDDEFRLITDEVAKYHQMKLEIRAGAQKMHAGVAPPVLDEETKNALIQRGRDEARASFIKKLAVSDSL